MQESLNFLEIQGEKSDAFQPGHEVIVWENAVPIMWFKNGKETDFLYNHNHERHRNNDTIIGRALVVRA